MVHNFQPTALLLGRSDPTVSLEIEEIMANKQPSPGFLTCSLIKAPPFLAQDRGKWRLKEFQNIFCSILTMHAFCLNEPKRNVDRKPPFIEKLLLHLILLKKLYMTTLASTAPAAISHFLSHFSILFFLSTYYYLMQPYLAIIQLNNLSTTYLLVSQLYPPCRGQYRHLIGAQIFLSEKNEQITDYFTSASKASNNYLTSPNPQPAN